MCANSILRERISCMLSLKPYLVLLNYLFYTKKMLVHKISCEILVYSSAVTYACKKMHVCSAMQTKVSCRLLKIQRIYQMVNERPSQKIMNSDNSPCKVLSRKLQKKYFLPAVYSRSVCISSFTYKPNNSCKRSSNNFFGNSKRQGESEVK